VRKIFIALAAILLAACGPRYEICQVVIVNNMAEEPFYLVTYLENGFEREALVDENALYQIQQLCRR